MAISKRVSQPNNWARAFLVERHDYAAADIGHVISSFHLTAKKCTSPSVHARMFPTMLQKRIVRASSSSTLTARIDKSMRGEFATPSESHFVPAAMTFG